MSGRRSRTWWSTPSRTRSSSRPSLHHGAPPATRQVAVDDPPGERAEREQQHARAGLVQQQLTHAEQHAVHQRSEEHTSELQSLTNLVCRLLLEKKKQQNNKTNTS